jgi:type I restriction enzyme S subunit
MGSNWTTSRIDQIATVKSGKRLPKEESLTDKKTAYPYIRLVDIEQGKIHASNIKYLEPSTQQKISRYIVETDDVCLAIVGHTIGMVFYVEDEWNKANLTENAARLTDISPSFNPRYIYYYLTSPVGQSEIISRKVGSAQGKLPLYNIKGLEIKAPDRTTQDRIADILLSLDKKIALNRQINQTLEQMAQALFKSWFVDFDPVVDNALDAGFFEQDLEFPDELLCRAEARKAVRKSADFKPLPEDIRQIFPAAFEECSEPSLGLGGWIPGGWVVSTTGDEFTVKGGSTPSTANPEFWEGGNIHWTSPKDLSGSKEKIMLDTERKITCAGLNKITSGLLPSETVLMSSRAPIGYLALTKIPVAINQGYIAIPATKRLSQEYVLYWLNSSIDEIKGIAGGTTFAEISKKTFKSISIVIPDTDVVDIFSDTTKSYLNKMTLNAVERAALEQLRDTLLPKLISGELRLSGSEVDTADEVLA